MKIYKITEASEYLGVSINTLKTDTTMSLRVGHFFAGGGGGMLADEILGHNTVLAVEIDKTCCDVLRNAQKYGWWKNAKIWNGDIREFPAEQWTGKLDCISAGFPCQDISSCGTRKGIEGGERSSLIFSLLEKIDVIRPPIVFLENSPEIRTRGRVRIISELLARGYAYRDGILAASDVGAPHRRKRWWYVAANSVGINKLWSERSKCVFERSTRDGIAQTSNADGDAIRAAIQYTGAGDWIPIDAGIRGMDNGLADWYNVGRYKRIKMLGNGQVPLCAAAAFYILAYGELPLFEKGE